jgi:hypothetical protein
MKTTSFAAAAITLAALFAPAHAEVTVIDNRRTIEVDCAKDPEVNLVGNHIKLTTKGVCARITLTGNHEVVTGSATAVHISGNHNKVMMDAADEVSVAGNHNTISVRKALTRKAPRIGNVGNYNKVTEGK